MSFTVTTGIYSIDRIDAAARAAVNGNVPHDKANPYPLHSIARFAFSQAYQSQVQRQGIVSSNPTI